MITLKCKVCGGPLKILADRIAECTACGSKMLLPAVEDDVRNEMFMRGHKFLSDFEFERAASAFEQIVARDPDDAEARFCTALAHYGVVYVQDPRTREYKINIHRANTRSILEDVDYLAALKCAPAQYRAYFEEQGRAIDAVWQKIMEIVRYEDPYDIFICYKETPLGTNDPRSREPGKERTEDSVIAEGLYNDFTKRGARVFFSRISLEDHLGKEWEPYIFAALQSAKVMLLVATNPAHIESTWVKNEWQRFQRLCETDSSRELYPVLKGMSAESLPDEIFEMPQMLDETGVRQDLIRGVLKIIGKTEGTTVLLQNRDMEAAADQLLAQGSWDDARMLAHKMLDGNPQSAPAYRILFLAENKADTLEHCAKSVPDYGRSLNFKMLQRYATGSQRAQVDNFITKTGNWQRYNDAVKLMDAEDDREQKLKRALEEFGELEGFEDAHELALECGSELRKIDNERERQRSLEEYRRQVDQAAEIVIQRWKNQKPKEYEKAMKLRGKTQDELEKPGTVAFIACAAMLVFTIAAVGVVLQIGWLKIVGIILAVATLIAGLVIPAFVLTAVIGIPLEKLFMKNFGGFMEYAKIGTVAQLEVYVPLAVMLMMLVVYLVQAFIYVREYNELADYDKFVENPMREQEKVFAYELEKLRLAYEDKIGSENLSHRKLFEEEA